MELCKMVRHMGMPPRQSKTPHRHPLPDDNVKLVPLCEYALSGTGIQGHAKMLHYFLTTLQYIINTSTLLEIVRSYNQGNM